VIGFADSELKPHIMKKALQVQVDIKNLCTGKIEGIERGLSNG